MADVTDGRGCSCFPFVGGALALDLVNTQVPWRGRLVECLASPQALVAWWDKACARHPHTAGSAGARALSGEQELIYVRGLRTVLRSLFTRLARGEPPEAADLEALNGVLGVGCHRLEIASGRMAGRYLPCHADGDGDVLLVTVAHAAYELALHAEPSRLRECANPRCVLLFYDTTRSATRRWCSARCMSRARSVERYARASEARRPADSPARPGTPIGDMPSVTPAGEHDASPRLPE